MGAWLSFRSEDHGLVLEAEESGKNIETASEVKSLFRGLEGKYEGVAELQLSENSYSEEACKVVSDMVSKCPNMTKANLSMMFAGRSEIGSSVESICQALRFTHLEVLDISDNLFGIPEVYTIASFIQQARNLQELYINNTNLGAEACKIMSEGLKVLGITVLAANRNSIEHSGALALAEALKIMKTLQKIDLSANRLSGKSMKNLIESFSFNPDLAYLDVSENSLKDCYLSVANCIERLECMQELNLSRCSLGNIEGIRIVLALKRTRSNLRKVSLSFNQRMNSQALGNEIIELLRNKLELECLELKDTSFSKEIKDCLAEENATVFSDDSEEDSDGESIDLDDI